MKEDKQKIELHIHDGAQINIAEGNAKIEASQKNISGNVGLKAAISQTAINGNKFEQKREEIKNLFDIREYEKIFNALKELKAYAYEENEIFWVEFLYGKYYLLLSDEEKNNKRRNLGNAMKFFEDAITLVPEDKNESFEDCHFYIVNCYIRMAEELGRVEWYEKGIKYCEKNIQEIIVYDKKGCKSYTTVLDYALLLVESSEFYTQDKAKENLEKAFSLFNLIYEMEEIYSNNIDEETIYRYFVNAGRCCQLLAEYTDEEEYLDSGIQFYQQLIQTGIINLRNPKRYGITYNNLGNIYALQYCINKGDIRIIDESRACYEKASKAYKNMGDDENYYECLSNMARAMVSIYDLNGKSEKFEEIEKLLNEVIEKRFDLEEVSGAYISKMHLAQLYVKYAEKNRNIAILNKAISLYDEILDYYSKDYMSDKYYKIYFGKLQAKSLLCTLKMEWENIGNNIKNVLEFLEKESYHMSSYVKELYVQELVENFFLYIKNTSIDKQEEIYSTMVISFRRMGVEIDEYIKTNE